MVDWVRLGDQLSHQVHAYPAKLLPHIAHFFANASSLGRPGQTLLDPFCGSGTVALEASLAGFVPYVADANPLALLLTRVKTTPYECSELRAVLDAIVKRARRYRTAPAVPVVNEHLWYLPHQKAALEIVLRAIGGVSNEQVKDFFLVCFSSTARRLSMADLAVSVPVRLQTKPHFEATRNQRIHERLNWVRDAAPIAEFARVAEANIRRVEETNRLFPMRQPVQIAGTDARALVEPSNSRTPLADASVPLVVTSPPYGSAQKYIRASSLSLNWLGLAGPKELAELEARSIGREHLSQSREKGERVAPLPDGIRRKLRVIAAMNPLRAQLTQTYLEEMRVAAIEIARVTQPDGHAVVVIGNNQVCGQPLRNDKFLIDCFRVAGMDVQLNLIDHIKSRGLMTKRNKTASMISRESVLVFGRRT